MDIPEPGVYKFADPGGGKISLGFGIPPRIDLYRDELATGLAKCPSHPHNRTAGRCPDFQPQSIVIIDNQVVENLAVLFRNIQIMPATTLGIEKLPNLSVKSRYLFSLCRTQAGNSGPRNQASNK